VLSRNFTRKDRVVVSPVIELRNVSLTFGTETLLEKVNVSVASGEVLVLIGPSGQGKSVLLKLMAGLIVPSRGEVFIEGRDLQKMRGPDLEILARKMGMLFQKNALFDSMTSGDNIAFPLREVAGAGESEIKSAIEYYLEAVGLGHARDLFPDEISGGMQKRLGIARALALKPQIVFYDDPTAGLDPITSRKIIQLIKDLHVKFKMTIVSVTNDMNRAFQMASRIAMVVDQQLIITGTPDETKRHPDPRVQQFIRGQVDGPLTAVRT
jgi:phospholipid/cholesterol/gamma-HCH transport system ATP-binding protein